MALDPIPVTRNVQTKEMSARNAGSLQSGMTPRELSPAIKRRQRSQWPETGEGLPRPQTDSLGGCVSNAKKGQHTDRLFSLPQRDVGQCVISSKR